MTAGALNGISSPSNHSFFLDPGDVSTTLDVGAARVALDGTRPRLMRQLGLYLAGYNGTTVFSVWIGTTSSSAFSVGSSGSSIYQGLITLAGTGHLIRNTGAGGTTVACGYSQNRAGRFGRGPYSGRSVAHSNPADGSFSNSTLAGEVGWQDVPSAPLGVAAAQVGVSAIRVTWNAPADNGGGFEGVTGYRVQASQDPTFATGVTSKDVGGTVREATFSTLGPGLWYTRVLAINAVTAAAGTYSPASATASATIVAETGNIDSWTTTPELPSGAQAITAAGLRRATVNALPGSPSALLKETNVIAGPVTLATDTYEMQRTVTGLTVGKVYRLTANAALVGDPGANTPNRYQLGLGTAWGDPVDLALNTITALPSIEFTATATSHLIRVRLAEAVTAAGNGALERLAVFGIVLSEIVSASPFRLRSIDWEGSLAAHFDLANNSVGARWWVDAYGVTQFSASLGTEDALVTFTDHRTDGHLEYTDLGTSLDTRRVVNDLTVNQRAVGGDETLNYKELTSIATNATRQASMDMSLYDTGAYAGSVDARVTEIFGEYGSPEFTITGITWNAQEDPDLAARLDVYTAVDVVFRGNTYRLRIVNIKHRATPARWMIDLELDRR